MLQCLPLGGHVYEVAKEYSPCGDDFGGKREMPNEGKQLLLGTFLFGLPSNQLCEEVVELVLW